VTGENLREYFTLQLERLLIGQVNLQLTRLLQGLYDVVPQHLLIMFDFQELELLLCGLPNIDVDDWVAHTEYRGKYERQGLEHKVVKWFWQCIRDLTAEERAKLLQFVTGTSRVPAQVKCNGAL
jgi:hypothetical protein